eukprot:TRINITY_DN11649_c0_g1_i1.p1 TRINITY_DN11649_c0_g1~~TRINITY_DN11649_c0_g1_i1.p1  ORF type:complete len:547 (+),score=109.43 TRINITY_DN11649_c0_g1_i1:796-2436(+)
MGLCNSKEDSEPLLSESTKLGSGAALEDDYRVDHDTIGYGRMASVCKGWHKESGQAVAIKACSKKLLNNRPARMSRTLEVEALQQLWSGNVVCPHVIQLFGTYEDSDYIYVVMELCQGGDLWHSLVTRATFTEVDVAKIAQQLLQAVAHCHERRVVHRDLKPDNILLTGTADIYIKVVDFGSAEIVKEGQVLHDFMATPYYAAPEVWTHNYGMEVDIWSVGAVLYVLLTGAPPSRNSKTIHEDTRWKALQEGKATDLPEGSSPALAQLLARLLEPNPEMRISAAEALKHPWITGEVPRGTDHLEGSMRGIRSYYRIRQFQKAAVVLLSVLLDTRDLKRLAAHVKSLKSPNGNLPMPQLEDLLTEMNLTLQSSSLRRLRLDMLPIESGALSSSAEMDDIEFDVEDFLELLECRKLALAHSGRGSQRGDDSQERVIGGSMRDGGYNRLGAYLTSPWKQLAASRSSPSASTEKKSPSKVVKATSSQPRPWSVIKGSSASVKQGEVKDEDTGDEGEEDETRGKERRKSSSVHGDMVYGRFVKGKNTGGAI